MLPFAGCRVDLAASSHHRRVRLPASVAPAAPTRVQMTAAVLAAAGRVLAAEPGVGRTIRFLWTRMICRLRWRRAIIRVGVGRDIKKVLECARRHTCWGLGLFLPFLESALQRAFLRLSRLRVLCYCIFWFCGGCPESSFRRRRKWEELTSQSGSVACECPGQGYGV